MAAEKGQDNRILEHLRDRSVSGRMELVREAFAVGVPDKYSIAYNAAVYRLVYVFDQRMQDSQKMEPDNA